MGSPRSPGRPRPDAKQGISFDPIDSDHGRGSTLCIWHRAFQGFWVYGMEAVAITAGTALGGLSRLTFFATMASRGILRWCGAKRSSSFLFSCPCSSGSCSSCASLPSTSDAVLHDWRAFSSSSSCGSFGCGSGSAAGECEDAGMKSSYRIRQFSPFVEGQSGTSVVKSRLPEG